MKLLSTLHSNINLPVDSAGSAFHLHVDDQAVAWLSFDCPDSSVNLWSADTLQQLVAHIEQLEHQPNLRGLVIQSAKPKNFIAGADLKTLRHLPPTELEKLIWLGQAAFDRLARLPMPKVALIHGACAGGGYELALACDWRIATDDPLTRIGLPETQLGLIPAWGGSVRLPRLVGLRSALDVILGGKLHPAKVAFKKGLVTHLVPQQAATALAAKLACQPRPKPVRHWDCLPGVAHLIAKLATRQVLKQTRGHYPAPLAAVDVMLKSLRLTVEEGLALERSTMVQLAQTPVAGHLIDLFFLREAANKSRPASGHALPITHAAVIGAGVMGSGIAQTLVTRGVNTLLTDVQPSAIGRGVQQIRELTAKAAARRVFTSKQTREALDRLNTAHTAVPLHRYGLIIEAATENLELKKKIFADLAARCGADSILATNTSALSVSALAATVPNPERVIGLHFFNPVHKMPLVEIITLPETSADVIATATAFVQGLGKTPVLVKDSPGFVVNRILMPYLMEAVHLHESGTAAATIDHAMLAFGMPMGPLRLLDEIGLDVAQHVADTLSTAFPERFRPSNLLREKIAAGQLGRKSGRGFYDYHGGRDRRDRVERIDPKIQQRLSQLITDEAQRCLDENLTARASDINLAMILGTGYPPFTGGPLNNI